MSAKNISVAMSEGKTRFAARHHDAVMVTKTSMMVRVVVHEVTRCIEVFCASAGVKLVRVFPVVGGGSNHSETKGWRR